MRSYEREQFIPYAEPIGGSDYTGVYMGLPEFYFASDIYIGEFGQIGLTVVDRRPFRLNSRVKVVGLDSPLVPAIFQDPLLMGKEDFRRAGQLIMEEFRNNGRGRFFDQIYHSMAALRFYALPSELSDALMKDRFLGPALIRKICEEDLPIEPLDSDLNIPEAFVRKSTKEQVRWLHRNAYEEPVVQWAHHGPETTWESILVEGLYDKAVIKVGYPLNQLLDSILNPLTGRSIDEYLPIAYVMYFQAHPIVYKTVTKILEPCIAEVVQRFDDLWRHLEYGKRSILPSPRELQSG